MCFPKHLYHYTSFENFCEIVKSNKFSLSSFEKANDPKESALERREEILKYKYISFCHNNQLDLYSYTNQALWSHYANRGNGVCIRFDGEKLSRLCKYVRAGFITYKDGITPYDEARTIDFIMMKRKFWQTEDEFRVVYDASIDRLDNIIDAIDEIYIGYKVPENKWKEFIEAGFISGNISIRKAYVDRRDGRILVNKNDVRDLSFFKEAINAKKPAL